ncbi:MAG: exodeoxyribonuclease V subunit alpha [Proteobacteria bacterium]|nr:exodeoxyribonuclease V subunit alpha [Pseudomonadota bacterium]MBU4013508.1 exodeoxyribonuclease V subunit alpha [Pseudomonadota bacterium]MBU4068115.1 exodeoxyribonuclease V subunit alpha [Pseudomonadota bacterium]MBU4100907.1 exodeoxyribonuclease V subunit alpha [Pseudomonadota bacterium]MBU4127782.1 exodeoxyribonuclease V subunit alpha [Pseudomonadota bacterium]
MNKDNLVRLHQAGILTDIDVHFAGFMANLADSKYQEIFLGAALASNVTGKGDVCLDLASFAGKTLLEKDDGMDAVICPELSVWKENLISTRIVGRPEDLCPLILDERNRLYLYRYWEYEKKLSDSIKKRTKEDIGGINLLLIKDSIKRLFPEIIDGDINRQKVAAITSAFKKFCVISGGPGTGKTTIIAKILAMLIEQTGKEKSLRIFLTAPTGKATARLSESIGNIKKKLNCKDYIKVAIPTEAFTIHRLLKTIIRSPFFRHNSENPLPADIVVVDEASMVDLPLMSKLIQAVPVDARLILIGDSDQLASVDPGSVLGDICGNKSLRGFTTNFVNKVEELTDEKITDSIKQHKGIKALHDCIVVLKKNYRFADSSGIGGLSHAVKLGDIDKTLDLLKNKNDRSIIFEEILSADNFKQILTDKVVEFYSEYLRTDDPGRALKLFNRFKILCAVKMGQFGVYAVNKIIEQILRRENLIQTENLWYKGRPILITSNDYKLSLFNGDIGITMPIQGSASNDMHVFFRGTSGELKQFLPYRLPQHETVYAMTVHKSQGSEFENVFLVLPDKDYPVLSRELIYTGITRASQSVTILGKEEVLRTSISRVIERKSGLHDSLWGGKSSQIF